MKTSYKIAIVAAVVLIIAGSFFTIRSSGPGVSGSVDFNFDYEDQLIVDRSGSGSMIPKDNMVFCVVSYTIHNNTTRDIGYSSSDVGLRIGNLSYSPVSLYANHDGSWTIESGATHQGLYAFEVPEGHAEPKFTLGLGERFDAGLEVSDIPEREAGQVYGKIYYNIGKPFLGQVTVSIMIRNISFEQTISNNPNYFHLTDGRGIEDYSWDSFHISDNDLNQNVPPGELSKQFYIIFDVPTNWDDGRELSVVWDGYPERGMVYTTNLVDIMMPA